MHSAWQSVAQLFSSSVHGACLSAPWLFPMACVQVLQHDCPHFRFSSQVCVLIKFCVKKEVFCIFPVFILIKCVQFGIHVNFIVQLPLPLKDLLTLVICRSTGGRLYCGWVPFIACAQFSAIASMSLICQRCCAQYCRL